MRRWIAGSAGFGLRAALLGLVVSLLAGTKANGDIYEWTLSGGSVAQSTTVCPDGSGVSAVPGAELFNRDLTLAYLISANLTNANLYSATLTDADLAGANLTNANCGFTVLTGANLAGANLSNSGFNDTDLTNANLAGAIVAPNVSFAFSNLTASQLYTTASYQARSLQGINLAHDNLTGWDFSGQDLSNAYLTYGTLTNANLTGANLRSAFLFSSTLSSADMRGAIGFTSTSSGAMTTNTILPDGTIQGLTLDSVNSTLIVRNYSGTASLPVHIQQAMTLSQSASLVLQFDGNPWGSTISFDSGIPVTLGGNLELDVVAGVNPSGLVGDSFQVFDWTGVSPSSQFANITDDLPAGYSWDTSQLYTTGNVTLVPEPSTLLLLVVGVICLIGHARQDTPWLRSRKHGATASDATAPCIPHIRHQSAS